MGRTASDPGRRVANGQRHLAWGALPIIAVLSFTVTASPVRVECTCRVDGSSVPLGTVVCMAPAGASALYRCIMNLDVTTWQKIADICPNSNLMLDPTDPHSTADPRPMRMSIAHSVAEALGGGRSE